LAEVAPQLRLVGFSMSGIQMPSRSRRGGLKDTTKRSQSREDLTRRLTQYTLAVAQPGLLSQTPLRSFDARQGKHVIAQPDYFNVRHPLRLSVQAASFVAPYHLIFSISTSCATAQSPAMSTTGG